MYVIKVHDQIINIFAVFYFMGYWHYDKWSVFRKWSMKLIKVMQLSLQGLFSISLAVGAYITEDRSEKTFLLVCSIISTNLTARHYIFVKNSEVIIKLTHQFCTHLVKSHEEFIYINKKIDFIMKISRNYILAMFLSSLIFVSFHPLLSDEKRLPLNIYSPLDWKNSDISYVITYAFILYQFLLYITCNLFYIIVWYQMIACATKYQTLRNEFKNLFSVHGKTSLTSSVAKKQQIFLEELYALTKAHLNLQE